MNSKPLFSIITVSKNAELLISRTLHSLNAQTYRNFEHVIIDGASEDNTKSIVENLRRNNTLFLSEQDEGIYYAMNKGLNIAKGVYFSFLNAGDTYDIKMLEMVSKIISSNLDLDLICADARVIGVNGKIRIEKSDPEAIKKHMIPHLGIFIRNKFDRTQSFDTRFRIAADYHFLLSEIAHGGTLRRIPKPLATFYDGGFSNTPENRIRSILETQALRRQFGYIGREKEFIIILYLIVATILKGPYRMKMITFIFRFLAKR